MKWFSIKDQMPDFSDGQIIVSNYRKGGSPPQIVICAVCYDGVFYLLEHWGAEENNRQEIIGVTHWQPLPSPPKENTNNLKLEIMKTKYPITVLNKEIKIIKDELENFKTNRADTVANKALLKDLEEAVVILTNQTP